jgi:hypothetical protein
MCQGKIEEGSGRRPTVGEVNHCRLAKSRDWMFLGKYSAVIGWETRIFVRAQPDTFAGYGTFTANYRAVFPPLYTSKPSKHGILPNDSVDVGDSG